MWANPRCERHNSWEHIFDVLWLGIVVKKKCISYYYYLFNFLMGNLSTFYVNSHYRKTYLVPWAQMAIFFFSFYWTWSCFTGNDLKFCEPDATRDGMIIKCLDKLMALLVLSQQWANHEYYLSHQLIIIIIMSIIKQQHWY